ncbi:MAG: OmpA family protein [Planctomycetota bacterium]
MDSTRHTGVVGGRRYGDCQGFQQFATCFAVLFFLLLGVGCANNNPYLSPHPLAGAQGTAGGSPWQVPTAGVSVADAQIAELRRRAEQLDKNNEQLHIQVAQSEKRAAALGEELDLVRSQLRDVSSQLDTANGIAANAQTQMQGMQASMRVRGGATLRPNTNLKQMAARLASTGLPVRHEGDVVRILLPSDQLFQPGTAQLMPQSTPMLENLGAQLRNVFPRQRVGIEGYTDAGSFNATAAHQLTSLQTSAVLDVLTRRGQLPPAQLFSLAQGANHPRGDNNTAAGRAQNRRIEVTIYPETF